MRRPQLDWLGLCLLAPAVVLVGFVTGKLVDRFGGRTVTVAAFIVSAIATVPSAFADDNTNLVLLTLVLFVRGIGIGAVLIPPMTLAYQEVEPESVAHASMNTRIMQQVGASFGTAIVAVVLQFVSRHIPSGDPALQAFHLSFWRAVDISLLSLVPAFASPCPGRRRTHHPVNRRPNSGHSLRTPPPPAAERIAEPRGATP